MPKANHGYAAYLIAVLGAIGAIFNLFQMIIIISGGYNRNPNIDSPILQTIDAIALTALWLVVSIGIIVAAIRFLRQSHD